MRPGVRIHVHDDAHVLDATRALTELARGTESLAGTLCAMCGLVAELAEADVVSVYLREQRAHRDVLVMRGNVGFPASAIGQVELGLYEGLTGVVAGRRRPVTVAVAQADERYKHVDGIGEEQFPAYLGVPLLRQDAVVGVLVLQRRQARMFTAADVALASSLTAPFSFVIERDEAPTFTGTARAPGQAAGIASVLHAAGLELSERVALEALEADLVTATQRLGTASSPPIARALDNLGLVAVALRERASDPSPRGDVMTAIERVPYRISGDKDLGALLDERRSEVVDLWSFLAADARQPYALCGGVLVTRRLGTFLAVEAVARGAAAVVVGGSIEHDATAVLHAAGVPAIADVPGLLARVRGGERLEVDATRGTVRIV